MNKKEIAEIKKQFTPANCAITRICGCYVDAEKNKKTKIKEAFLSLPEEEMFKYFDIFKKTMSGRLGKSLMNLEFPLAQEKEGGTQEFLMRIRASKLKDDDLLDEFYDKVIENYDYPENYYIVLIHAVYDIPGKASDGTEMHDASEEIYEHILCSICPVNLSKAGLSYDVAENNIKDRIRDWVVSRPETGFLFPVFNDRSTDIHGVLYYSKKPEDLQPEFIENALGCTFPMSAGSQKDTFHAVVMNTLGEECDYTVVKNIHDNLNEMIEETKDAPEVPVLTKPEVKRLLAKSGVADEKIEIFDNNFDTIAGEKASFLATNIAETRKFSIETPDVSIKVNPDRTDLVETKMIDGKQCLVIEINDQVEVNGVPVRTLPIGTVE